VNPVAPVGLSKLDIMTLLSALVIVPTRVPVGPIIASDVA
jgi:hypothetical protein